jgi:hypothetical protein
MIQAIMSSCHRHHNRRPSGYRESGAFWVAMIGLLVLQTVSSAATSTS